MSGRYYRVKRLRKRVNRFTADDYDNVCTYIAWANIDPANRKHVIVKHANGKMAAVASKVVEILKLNQIGVESYGKYASTNVKTVFRFASKDDASKAQEIVNKMSADTVNRSAVNTEGITVTNHGVKIKVDLERKDDGTIGLKEGSTYIPTGTAASAQASSSSSLAKWLLIGGAALVAIVVVLAVLKKKRIIK